MAKINLLTIHFGNSYGAVMQTYATCRLLEEAGHTVTVINISTPKGKIRKLSLQYIKNAIRNYSFNNFKKQNFSAMTKKGYSIDECKIPDADYTVVGSDQVWNRDITGRFGKTFFLDFVNGSQKRISLSSSFGKSTWNEDEAYTKEVKRELEKFTALSVRENTAVEILNNTFGLEAVQLLDPTLGYGKFEHLILNDTPVEHIYPFLLNTGSAAIKRAELIAKETDTPLFKHTSYTATFEYSPRHWLTNIHNAKYVITDSFHGLALSIIFHKHFFVFCADPKKFTRLQSLLQLIGHEERFVTSEDDFLKRKEQLMQPIDYKKVNSILNREQEKYREFIRKNIF